MMLLLICLLNPTPDLPNEQRLIATANGYSSAIGNSTSRIYDITEDGRIKMLCVFRFHGTYNFKSIHNPIYRVYKLDRPLMGSDYIVEATDGHGNFMIGRVNKLILEGDIELTYEAPDYPRVE